VTVQTTYLISLSFTNLKVVLTSRLASLWIAYMTQAYHGLHKILITRLFVALTIVEMGDTIVAFMV